MTTEVIAQTVTAGVPSYFGQGRIWYLKAATSAVSIICRKSGQGSSNVRRFINVAAGFKFKADAGDGWDILELTSAATQNIEIIVGDDDVEVSNAVTVNGSVTTQEQPYASFDCPADVAVGAGATSDIPANASRKAIRIGSLSSNTDPLALRVQEVGGPAASGDELQAGTAMRYPTTGTIRVRNPGAVSQTYTIFEEL